MNVPTNRHNNRPNSKSIHYTSELLIYNTFNITLDLCCSEFVDYEDINLN
jgi:hypothetical protein